MSFPFEWVPSTNKNTSRKVVNQLERKAGEFYTASVADRLTQVNDIFGANYNGILVNKYKTGDDYISAHSDDEKNLDDF